MDELVSVVGGLAFVILAPIVIFRRIQKAREREARRAAKVEDAARMQRFTQTTEPFSPQPARKRSSYL